MRSDTLRRCPACRTGLVETGRFCPDCGRDTLESALQTEPAGEEQSHATPEPPSVVPSMRLPQGTRLSVYRIQGVIGEGGMGVVYRAYDEALDRWVALKCLHSNLAGDCEIRRRFAREAQILRS